ncbi:MAG: hypothetical protein EPO00_00690 [Chloroflexota bacterium]|nr:MAG: hypothetical protein EPO00_00690 [Chloroflexota bacterium]
METRDRRINLLLFAAAGLAWVAVGFIVLTLDPVLQPAAAYAGAVAIGVAMGLTTMPLLWLVPFGWQRRIAFRGAWVRAIRRGTWIGLFATILVVLRVQGLFQLPVALFIGAMVVVAEMTLSAER